jgi:hypothetical protein
MLTLLLCVFVTSNVQNKCIELCISMRVMELIWEFEFRVCRYFVQRKKECEGIAYCLSLCVCADNNEQYQYIRHAGSGKFPSWLPDTVTMHACTSITWDVMTGDDARHLRHPNAVTKSNRKDMKAVQEAWSKMMSEIDSHASIICPEAFFIAEVEENEAVTFVHNVDANTVVSKINESRRQSAIQRCYVDAIAEDVVIRGLSDELKFLNQLPCIRPCKFTAAKHNTRLSTQYFMESPRYLLLQGSGMQVVAQAIEAMDTPLPSSQLCRKRKKVSDCSPDNVNTKRVSHTL